LPVVGTGTSSRPAVALALRVAIATTILTPLTLPYPLAAQTAPPQTTPPGATPITPAGATPQPITSERSPLEGLPV